jgi:signal transduction histidine kinase/CheY-like chemotaxis protein
MYELLSEFFRKPLNFVTTFLTSMAGHLTPFANTNSIQPLDFQTIFEAIPNNCLILDRNFIIIGVNDAYLKATNTDHTIIVGRSILDVFPSRPVGGHSKGDNNLSISLQRVLRAGKKEKMGIQRCDIPLPGKSGLEMRYWRPIITPVLNPKKEVNYIICQLEDVTLLMTAKNEVDSQESKEKLLNSPQLRRATKNAQKANQPKIIDKDRLNKFMERVCHEVRNPLFVITGKAELLKEQLTEFFNLSEKNNLSPGTRSFLENMQQLITDILLAGNFQKETVEQMLELAKLENNPEVIERSYFNPKKLIQDLMDEFKPKAIAKNIFIELELPDENIVILSDLSRLKYILRHLVENAIKFTSEGGVTIKIDYPKVEQADQVVVLNFTVEDTGSGMDAEEIKLLFQGYTQSFDSENSGFGLGMAICKEMIISLSGEINVKSKKGQGSQFHFDICATAKSLSAEEILEAKDEQKLPLSFPKTPLNILVVEDNEMIRKMLVKNLEKEGYIVGAASNGSEAIKHFKEKKFDIIFMDMKMPVMDGISTTKEIRKIEEIKRLAPTVIIGISADNPETYGKDIKEIGLDYYFIKPCSPKNLRDKLNQIAYKKSLDLHSTTSSSSFWEGSPSHTTTKPEILSSISSLTI